MGLFLPLYRFHRITDIPHSFFGEHNITGLILDVDNTLTTHDNPHPGPGVEHWLQGARERGIRMVILSNNHPERVQPFADMLGLDFVADAGKPRTGGIVRACRALGTPPSRTAMIGDQLFTDILGGNLAKLLTVLVDPIEPESTAFFRLKRFGERLLLKD